MQLHLNFWKDDWGLVAQLNTIMSYPIIAHTVINVKDDYDTERKQREVYQMSLEMINITLPKFFYTNSNMLIHYCSYLMHVFIYQYILVLSALNVVFLYFSPKMDSYLPWDQSEMINCEA